MVLAWCRNGWAGRQSPFLSPWAAFPRPHPAPAHFFGNLGHYFTRNKWWALPLVPSTTFCPPGPHSCRVAACPPVSLLYPEASSSQSCLALCRGCPWPWASPGTAGQLTGWGPGPGRWAGGGPTWALGGGTAGRQPSGSEPPSAGLASEHRGQALERRGLVPKDAGSWPSAARVFPELAAPHIPSGRGAAPLRRSRPLGRLMRCPGRLSQRPTGSCSRRFPHPPPATASEPSPAAPPTLRRPRRAPLWRPARGGRADRGFCLDSGTPGPEGARGDGGLRTREAPRAAAGAPRVRAGAREQGAPQAGGAGLRARW